MQNPIVLYKILLVIAENDKLQRNNTLYQILALNLII